jgi:hypothetical protein
MKGKHAFCPQSGATLNDDRHYVDSNIAYRAPVEDSVDDSWTPLGELTTGELVSSCTALTSVFRRCQQLSHADYYVDLYGTAALALRRLKSETNGWDVWIWYALAERLDRLGYDASWMHNHADPRCPRCSSKLRFEDSPTGYANMICGASCGTETSSDRTVEIYDRIKDVYNATFTDDPIDELHIF